MFDPQETAQFSETTLPKQDYLARIMGYSVAVVTTLVGIIQGHYSTNAFGVVIIALLYPHLIHVISRPFRKRHA